MNAQPIISEFMTNDPCGIDEDLSLADALDRMQANNIRHLVVLRDGALLGMIDSADLALCGATTDRAAKEVPVRAAVREAFRCSPGATLLSVVRTMERHHFTSAVVVDDSSEIVGIFTITDALHALRTQLVGSDLGAQVVPTHDPELPVERQKVLPNVRLKRMLRLANAAPSASDGMAFGTTGL